MASTAIPNAPGLLGTGATTYYTVGGGKVGNVKELLFCNVSTTATGLITAYFVPSGGSPGNANTVVSASTINVNTTVRIPFNTFLAAGDTVQALCNVANIVQIRCSSVEFG